MGERPNLRRTFSQPLESRSLPWEEGAPQGRLAKQLALGRESRRWSHRKPRWSGVIAGIPGKALPSTGRDPRYKNPPKGYSGPSRSTYPVA
jgi:hypothetical protein